jgi:hypothetical protein
MSSLSCKNVKIQDSSGTVVSTLSYDGTNITIDKPVSVPTAAPGTNTTQVATTGFVVGEKGGRRNYLINGNFDKWDYATSQTSAGYGSDNRWANNNNGSTKTHSQQVCGNTERALFNAMYYSRTVVTSSSGSSNYVAKGQPIENINLLAGKTVTLSFWAKADANRNIAIEFGQFFGTGGSPSNPVSGIGSQLVALTTTWQKKSITVTIPSIVGKTLGTDGVQTTCTSITFWFDAGSDAANKTANLGQQSGTFDIAQVKIEDGSVATNGWHPYDGEFGGEEQACYRYYEVGWYDIQGYTTGGSTFGVMYNYKSRKRVTPTVTEAVGSTNNNVSSIDVTYPTLDAARVRLQASNTGMLWRNGTLFSSAEL